jgi:hypothetical protein
MACYLQKEYADILQSAKETQLPEAEACESVLNFRLEDLGKAMAHHWSLPETVAPETSAFVSADPCHRQRRRIKRSCAARRQSAKLGDASRITIVLRLQYGCHLTRCQMIVACPLVAKTTGQSPRDSHLEQRAVVLVPKLREVSHGSLCVRDKFEAILR